MAASYKKLWKLLIDKDMKKEDLRKATGITTTAMAKLGRNENVNIEILLKICKAFIKIVSSSWSPKFGPLSLILLYIGVYSS